MDELNPYTKELLGILEEECAEVIQAISKLRRFGLMNFNPADPLKITNIEHLINEIGDIQGVVDMLKDTSLKDYGFSSFKIESYADKKKVKVPKFMRHLPK